MNFPHEWRSAAESRVLEVHFTHNELVKIKISARKTVTLFVRNSLSLFRTRFFEKCTKLNTLHVNKQTTNLNFEVDLPPPMQETRLWKNKCMNRIQTHDSECKIQVIIAMVLLLSTFLFLHNFMYNSYPWITRAPGYCTIWKVACVMDQVMATGCVGTATSLVMDFTHCQH